MKSLLATLVIFSSSAFAGDKVGNGGGLWVCQTPKNAILQTQLVDLFEAENEFGLTLISPKAGLAPEIAENQIRLMRAENLVLSEELSLALRDVLSKVRYVQGILTVVDDSLFRLSPAPSICSGGTWNYVQFANFTHQNQVLIRADLWKSPAVTEVDRAALLAHEAVYQWLRAKKNDQDSVRTRQIVGYLFSTLSAKEKNQNIQAVIDGGSGPTDPIVAKWTCVVENSQDSKIFAGFGDLKLEASGAATQSCHKGSDAFFCEKSPRCEEAKSSAETWACQSTNSHEQKDFVQKGRTRLEAEYKARKSCELGSEEPFFCNQLHCENY